MARDQHRRLHASTPARLALLAGCALSLAAPLALAGPRGERVVRGKAQVSRQGDTTVIRASNNSIIEYRSFDVAAHETVQFVQPGANARVLNRVNSNDPTRIDGRLTGNGQVYLVNPSGVVFGPGSVIDVAGLHAAAAHMSNADFLAGVNHYTDASGNVINHGVIMADAINLIGERVSNHGDLVTNGGVIAMISGADVLIGERGGTIFVRVDGRELDAGAKPQIVNSEPRPNLATAAVENQGRIEAPQGIVSLGAGDTFSIAVRNAGRIDAPGGSVDLASSGAAVHNLGSIDVSSNGQGGRVRLAGQTVTHEGRILAEGRLERGGEITIHSARRTELGDASVVSASGGAEFADGGDVLVHSYRGDTWVEPGARVDISGGAQGGAGGAAEISAGHGLTMLGVVDANVVEGFEPATVLFDPFNIVIAAGPDSGPMDEPFRISPATIENTAADVTLQADNDIFIADSINKANGGLTLTAGRDILFAGEGGAVVNDVNVTAQFIDFLAGRDIVDVTIFGPDLVATTGDITLEATSGTIDFALATVAAGRTVRLVQADSRFFGAGPFGLIGNPESTNIELVVTDGFLILGGQFGGVSGFQAISNIDAQASQFLRVEDDLEIGANANLRSAGRLELDGFIHAGNSIALHGDTNGNDGAGADLVFLSGGLDLAAPAISLRAGANAGTGQAFVDARTNAPTFRGAALGATNPGSFTIRQDAAVSNTTLPFAAQFGAGSADGLLYRLESDDGAITLANNSFVDGSRLTLVSEDGSSINGDLSLASLDVFGETNLNADVETTGLQRYRGAVALGANATLDASLARFDDTVDGGFDLDVNADLRLGDAVGDTTPLASLDVAGETTMAGARVTTSGDQTYRGAVTLADHTSLVSEGGGVLEFRDTIDSGPAGPFDLTLRTTEDGLLVFGGDVGANDALRDLALSTAGSDGVRDIPDRATIVGESDLQFVVRDFLMGQHEKFTTLGALDIDASRTAALGDLVTQGDLVVTAPDIELLLRAADNLLDSDGSLVDDRGLDFVSGGELALNGAITLSGAGGAPAPTFGAAVGEAPMSITGLGFEFTTIEPALVSNAALTFDGATLDQKTTEPTAPPPPPPPGDDDDFDASPDLAGARITPQFEDSVRPEAYDAQRSQRLGVAARGVQDSEGVGGVVGRVIYSDMPAQPDGFTTDDYQVVATRLDIESVRRAIQTLESLYGPNNEIGAEAVARAIEGAMRRFESTAEAGAFDAVAFNDYLVMSPEEAEALRAVETLRALVNQVTALGLTERERRAAERRLLTELAQEDVLPVERLRQMIRAEPTVTPPNETAGG